VAAPARFFDEARDRDIGAADDLQERRPARQGRERPAALLEILEIGLLFREGIGLVLKAADGDPCHSSLPLTVSRNPRSVMRSVSRTADGDPIGARAQSAVIVEAAD
jgi:hypothetical protein